MQQWNKHLAESDLEQAINSLITDIKSSPKDANLRSALVELLCIDGDFERADAQLMSAIKLFPEFLAGASQLRHLVKAAQARQDFHLSGGATATFLESDSTHSQGIVDFNLAMHQNDVSALTQHNQSREESRTKSGKTVNQQEAHDLRDIDDQLSGYLELFSSAGNYYLVPFENVRSLTMLEPTTLLENVWRPIEFDIDGLGEGEAHMPLIYVNSQTGAQKLGRETDWKQVEDSEVYLGLGQKSLFLGESALPIFDVNAIETP